MSEGEGTRKKRPRSAGAPRVTMRLSTKDAAVLAELRALLGTTDSAIVRRALRAYAAQKLGKKE